MNAGRRGRNTGQAVAVVEVTLFQRARRPQVGNPPLESSGRVGATRAGRVSKREPTVCYPGGVEDGLLLLCGQRRPQ